MWYPLKQEEGGYCSKNEYIYYCIQLLPEAGRRALGYLVDLAQDPGFFSLPLHFQAKSTLPSAEESVL